MVETNPLIVQFVVAKAHISLHLFNMSPNKWIGVLIYLKPKQKMFVSCHMPKSYMQK